MIPYVILLQSETQNAYVFISPHRMVGGRVCLKTANSMSPIYSPSLFQSNRQFLRERRRRRFPDVSTVLILQELTNPNHNPQLCFTPHHALSMFLFAVLAGLAFVGFYLLSNSCKKTAGPVRILCWSGWHFIRGMDLKITFVLDSPNQSQYRLRLALRIKPSPRTTLEA